MSEADEGQRFKDLWAWADEGEDEQAVPPVSPSSVLGVMVVRDAAAWLPEQLAALAASTARPQRVVAVDAASMDESTALLAAAKEEGVLDEVVTLAEPGSFAEAVAAGIGQDDPEWLWILHDDSAPDPGALKELLVVAPMADVIYPKLLAPRRRNYPDIIAECGQSIAKGGQRVGVHEEGDIDQGQLDPAATLGGSTAGMLIRGSVWRELGGLAPELPGHRDGVDFGWRANLAGWRVVTAPRAALVHRRAGMTGERTMAQHPHVADRLAALRLVSVHGTSSARLRCGTWARALGFLLARAPALARAELAAHRQFRATKSITRSLAERQPSGDADAVADLLPPKYRVLRGALDRFGHQVSQLRHRDTSEWSLDELTADDVRRDGKLRPHVGWGSLLAVVFLVAGVAAGWRFWGGTDPAGGGLLPAPQGLAEAWGTYLREPSPALGFGAAIGTLFFGNLRLLALALLLIGPMLAALTACSFLRRAGVRASIAAIGGGVWAAATLLLGLPSAGDVSGLVVAIVAPLLAAQILRLVSEDVTGAEGMRAPALGAVWLFLLSAFWPPAIVGVTIVGVIAGLRGRGRLTRWAMLLVPAWLLMLPWLMHLLRHPGRWLTGVDPFAWPHFAPSGLGLLIGRLHPSGIPVAVSAVFIAGIALCAVAGVLLIRNDAARWGVVAAIAVPLLTGVGLSRLALPLEGGQGRALLSAWALLAVGGIVCAIVWPARHPDTGRRSTVPAVVAGVLALAAACAWPVIGLRGPVTTDGPRLPAYVRDIVESPRHSRVLMVEKLDGGLRWNVIDAEHPRWGSGERRPAGANAQEYELLVQGLTGGAVPDDLAERLRGMSISNLWLGGFTADELVAVGNAEGLTSAAASDHVQVFTVVGLVSRANVVTDGASAPVTDGVVPAGGKGRVLTIDDDRDLTVTVGGQALERIDGDLPTYRLDDAHGELDYGPTKHWFALWWTVALMATLVLFAMPTISQGRTARRAGEDEE